uniref:Uncharacterized protein n=1 Tax=viral metagenome TaxID=1070528 RepID=A0A6H1ZD36_9ZZZZ
MEINAYVYVESNARKLCFKCAVLEIIEGEESDYNLALEAGSSGDGNDMRSRPKCAVCGEYFEDYCIA